MSVSNALRPALRRRNGLLVGLFLSAAILPGCGADDVGGTSDVDDSVDTGDDDDDSPDAGTGGRDSSRPPPSGDDDEGDDDSTGGDDDDDDDDLQSCAAIRKDAPPGKGEVDIVMLIDTSGSMLHAVTQVTMNLAKFVQSFDGTNADTRVVVITRADPAAGSPLASNQDQYRFISSEVDSKALFTVALARFGDYGPFLRPNAVTQFVMVTDDNDIMPPATFKEQMEAQLKHPFIQHAIASESVNGLPCISEAQLWNPLCIAPIPAVCAAAAVGANYYSLADETAGAKMSICKNDWTSVFDELQKAVVEAVPLPCDYLLDEASAEEYDPSQVSVVYEGSDKKEMAFPKAMTPDRCGDNIGWFYDDNKNPTTIKLCPAACEQVQKGGSIDIAFGCEPPQYL